MFDQNPAMNLSPPILELGLLEVSALLPIHGVIISCSMLLYQIWLGQKIQLKSLLKKHSDIKTQLSVNSSQFKISLITVGLFTSWCFL